jgi:signal transduction histidine kinase
MSKVIIEQNMGGGLTARNYGGGAEFRIELPSVCLLTTGNTPDDIPEHDS